MARIKYFAVALLVTLCAANAPAHYANAADTAKHPAAATPTKVALMTLERSAYEAWKVKDRKFWDTYLSTKFVGWGSSGKLNKAAATEEYSGATCDITRYALSDEQMKPISQDAELITYKTTVGGTCDGQKIPANTWAASVYVHEGGRWKAVFHAAAPLPDPNAAPATPAVRKATAKNHEAESAAPDAATESMLAVEKHLWEAWRAHDGISIQHLMAKDITFINFVGTYFATTADALKDWTSTGCDVQRVSLSDATGTMLSPTVGILTFKGAADGTCYGQKIDSAIWGTSIYVKDGDAWKWNFGINVPSRPGGA